MRIAVVGAGSIGTIVGALIAKNGRDVVLIDIDEKNVATLNTKGATITGFLKLELTSTVAVLEKYAFDIGDLKGRITPRLKQVQEVLSAVGALPSWKTSWASAGRSC
jgi:2-dehydropantoate 2-reductase